MMLWGVSVTVIALVVGHLWAHYPIGPGANGLWGLMGVVALVDHFMRRRKKKKPITFVGKNINYVWTCFGVMAGGVGLISGILAGFTHLFTQDVQDVVRETRIVYCMSITCIIIFSMGIAGMITGCMLNSKTIIASCFIAGSVGSVLAVVFGGPSEMIVLAGSAVVGLIVPALIIRMKENEG